MIKNKIEDSKGDIRVKNVDIVDNSVDCVIE